MYDVVIAGAGPAGSVAATVLARAGARVIVFDRARFPRSKLCGDTVNPGAMAALSRLGLSAAVSGGVSVDGMVVTGEPAVRIEGRYSTGSGRAVTRRVFDAALVAAARAAGARVEEGVLVTSPLVELNGAEPTVIGLVIKGADGRAIRIPAPLVVAADGRASRIGRGLGLSGFAGRPRRWAVGAYFEQVAGLTSLGEMHIRRGHYLGVARLPEGIANACVVTSNRAALRDPKSLLLGALRHDGQLAARFADARLLDAPVCLGPLAVECRSAGVRGLLLAGDAAGFVDPMTGDGLSLAIRGAEHAALEALHALEHGTVDAHLRLLATRRRAFASKWRFNRALRTLVGSPIAVTMAGIGAGYLPAVLRSVIRYAGDVERQ
jgi:flavin-dependent dehydrogenase